MILKNISKKASQKNKNFPLKISYNSGSNMKYKCLLKVEYLLNGCTYLYEINFRKDTCTQARTKCLNARARVFALFARVHARISTENILVVSTYLRSLSFKFCKDLCIRWGDIQLLVTMYISYYTLNYSQFSTENFDFFGTPSYWYLLILSSQWQFLTRRKKTCNFD